VRGILNFAREEKLDRKPTDVNELVRASVSGILGASSGRYQVEWGLDDALGSQWVDASQLRQVFDNLITNAKEAMPDGGTIRIRTEAGESEFSVVIADNGPGIPEENLPKMFTPFFTTKKVGKGTGLGLSVCYGIVKMHGGTIQVSNNREGGARFTVRIRHSLKEGNGGSDSAR
jgi:two-component system NtrC family sensor kinase